MPRGLLVVVCIVGMVAAMVFGPRYLASDGDSSVDPSAVGAEHCDLDVKTCRWSDDVAAWSLDLERTGPEPTDPFRLSLLVPADVAGDARMIAVLEGQSMYMGQYPVALQRSASDDGRIRFHAEFQAPLCTVNPDMTWRITLKRSTDTLDIPMIPTFQARHSDAR